MTASDPLLPHRFEAPLPLDRETARRWLGGKGASVADMTRMGLRVPPGFTLGTGLFAEFESLGEELPTRLRDRLEPALQRLGEQTGAQFGSLTQPLLVAVRSGGPTSMPGMLDTVLNVGVNPEIAKALSAAKGAPERFGRDVERRFLESHAMAAFGVPRSAFDALGDATGLDDAGHERLLEEVRKLVAYEVGSPLTADPMEQLLAAIAAVLKSWRSPRAQKYREAHGIADDEGTGVTIQAMVYGNLGPSSGAGVVMSRHPNTGVPGLFGEWLPEVQGEDIVGGGRTPRPLARSQVGRGRDDESLETALPDVFAELTSFAAQLEQAHRSVGEVEFAFERGVAYALQYRPAKLAARASARVSVDLVTEGHLNRGEALLRFEPSHLRSLITPRLPDPEKLAERSILLFVRGLASSPGAATGAVVLDEAALDALPDGASAILVRPDTSAEDVSAMRRAAGVLTASGGLTSHAAVVARAIGKPCVTGATSLLVDLRGRRLVARGPAGEVVLREGDLVTLDGSRGLVYPGELEVEPSVVTPHVQTLLEWADERRPLEVLGRATSLREARVAMSFGADAVLLLGEGLSSWQAVAESVGRERLVLRLQSADAFEEIAEVAAELRAIVAPPEHLATLQAAAPDASILAAIDAPPAEGAWGGMVADAAPEALMRGVLPLLEREEPTLAQLTSLAKSGGALVVSPLGVPLARMLAGRAAGAIGAKTR